MDATYPTWKKYRCLLAAVSRMSTREKRRVFALMRNPACSHDMLLVEHGMTLGEFCCMIILSEPAGSSRR